MLHKFHILYGIFYIIENRFILARLTQNCGIIPKTKVSKVDALKEIIRAWGMNPEQILTKDALAEGAITYVNPADIENHQLVVLSNQLKELIRHEKTG